ncbi:hypothetical protein D4R87_02590 [bacterium]|nr:MAG: hypothetical protein D4R87_02590 [bacterium]
MPDLQIKCYGFDYLPQAQQSVACSLARGIAGIKEMDVKKEHVICSFNFNTYQVNSEKKTVFVIIGIFDRPKWVKELLVKKVKNILRSFFVDAIIVCVIDIFDSIYDVSDNTDDLPVKKYHITGCG